ncbi:MAG: pyruvate formate lyase [Clostridia bacterium]|nr:pyruvate formate lyase [Clostridia bacterium]
MTERAERLLKTIHALNDAGVRRTEFYPLAYASLKTTRGEPIELRRAKAEAYILDNASLTVLPDELITGTAAAFFPVCEDIPTVEEQEAKAVEVLEDYLKHRADRDKTAVVAGIRTFEANFTTKKSRWALMSRVYHDASITYDELQRLIAVMAERYAGTLEKYEIGRELERAFKLDYGKEVRAEIDALPWFAANHLSLDYGAMLHEGFGSRIARIKAELEKADSDFYRGQLIVAEAGSRFFRRYAETVRAFAIDAEPVRKAELTVIAERLDRLATEPAESFADGVQFTWMLQVMMTLLWGSALSFGRFDQYLSDLYIHDIESGVLTEEEAYDLLCCFWIKVNEPRMRTVQSLTIGGVTPDGRDGVNPLTFLCLRVIRDVQLPYPNVGARINEKNPESYRDAVIDCMRTGAGQPMLMNDAVWVPNFMRMGYTEAIANEYFNMGCVEVMIPGKQPNFGITEPIAFPMLFERLFERFKGREDSLDTYEAFRDAYFEQMEFEIDADYAEALEKQQDKFGKCYDPFGSMLVEGCHENGKDMFQGGAALGTHWSFYAYGLGTAADTLNAIRQCVYEDKRFTLKQLSDILRADFEGYEAERRILSSCHKYGNDEDDVDVVARSILSHFDDRVMALNRADSREKYVTSLFGYFFHVYHGEITGATANGRKRGEPFSDSMGPSQGQDVSGPTAMLNSVLKLDHGGVTGGYALNIKLMPSMLKGDVGRVALKTLMFAYIEDGGPQIQINFADAETLKKAKVEPAKYRNVIVRIGGYCEYFVNLDAALQDEIITRTMHEMEQ